MWVIICTYTLISPFTFSESYSLLLLELKPWTGPGDGTPVRLHFVMMDTYAHSEEERVKQDFEDG
jgi:hypothetical protein